MKTAPEPRVSTPPQQENFSEGICAVTGLHCAETLSRKDLFQKGFNDGATLAAPSSARVSVDAFVALKYKWERMSSWMCDGETFKKLDRQGVRAAVFGGLPVRPWIGYATTSYKKHGALRAPVNSGQSRAWLFENTIVDCSDNDRVLAIWERLNSALRLGFGRPILQDLQCPIHVMRKIGFHFWIDFEEWAHRHYKSSLYSFMCYLLPSQKELKKEDSE